MSEAKVTNFDPGQLPLSFLFGAGSVKQQVLKLKVRVDHSLRVDVLEAF